MYSDVRSAQSCMKQVIGPLVATFVSLEWATSHIFSCFLLGLKLQDESAPAGCFHLHCRGGQGWDGFRVVCNILQQVHKVQVRNGCIWKWDTLLNQRRSQFSVWTRLNHFWAQTGKQDFDKQAGAYFLNFQVGKLDWHFMWCILARVIGLVTPCSAAMLCRCAEVAIDGDSRWAHSSDAAMVRCLMGESSIGKRWAIVSW